jgi:hypothetical protein
MVSKQRLYLPPLAELIDSLTINQIKEVMLPQDKEIFAREMEKITHDIDLIIEERGLKLSARLVRIVVAVAQMNLHIWHNKDEMQQDPGRYTELLKLAHQLNGVRNQMKNLLLEEVGDKEKSARKTNYNTDGLKGWDISIK